MLKKLLNTFFFGYLPLRWRRVSRVFSFFFIIIVMVVTGSQDYRTTSHQDEAITTLLILAILFSCLVSWLIKPFVVKNE
tara:strand:+ start:239 stop:475 length:237 start_codon:yes stop_codon:yes gene_type:complete